MSVELSTSVGVTQAERDLAIAKIGKLIDLDAPTTHVDVRLEHFNDPAREEPALARALVTLDSGTIRAQVSAGTMTDAVNRLEQRLRRRLETMAEHHRALRRRGPTSGAGEWRHGDLSLPRPGRFERPVEERSVVRHKSFSTPDAILDEAIFDLESMDYDFYLFTTTGRDAVVWRQEGGTYRVQFAEGLESPDGVSPVAVVDVDQVAAPELSVPEAQELLDTDTLDWVFFRDPDSGRARVLYRRYDGNYGLLHPASEDAGT